MSEAPKQIWLQDAEAPHYEGTTWCWHSIDEGELPDVRYIRADLVTAVKTEAYKDGVTLTTEETKSDG